MNIRRQRKRKLAFLPRNNWTLLLKDGNYPVLRKNAIYFTDWCCKGCYYGWGQGAKHKHNCSESNNEGILKKYWKEYNLSDEDDLETNEG